MLKNRFKSSLAYTIIAFYILIVILFLASTYSEKLNNKLFDLTNFWPRVNVQKQQNKVISVRKDDFGPIREQVISITATTPLLTVTDTNTSNPFSLETKYYRLSDEPVVKAREEDQGRLIVEMNRMGKYVDLPIRPLPTALYEVSLGNLDTATVLNLNILSGESHLNFKEKPLQAINIKTDSGKVFLSFTKDALPQQPMILSSDSGDFDISLPPIPILIRYSLEEEGRIIIDEKKEIRGAEAGEGEFKYLSGSAEPFIIQVTTVDGDIFVNTQQTTSPSR